MESTPESRIDLVVSDSGQPEEAVFEAERHALPLTGHPAVGHPADGFRPAISHYEAMSRVIHRFRLGNPNAHNVDGCVGIRRSP